MIFEVECDERMNEERTNEERTNGPDAHTYCLFYSIRFHKQNSDLSGGVVAVDEGEVGEHPRLPVGGEVVRTRGEVGEADPRPVSLPGLVLLPAPLQHLGPPPTSALQLRVTPGGAPGNVSPLTENRKIFSIHQKYFCSFYPSRFT